MLMSCRTVDQKCYYGLRNVYARAFYCLTANFEVALNYLYLTFYWYIKSTIKKLNFML